MTAKEKDIEKLSDEELEEIIKMGEGEYIPTFEAIPGWKRSASPKASVVEAHTLAASILHGKRVRVSKVQLAKEIVNMYHAYIRLEKAYKDRPIREVDTCNKRHVPDVTSEELIGELSERAERGML